MMKHISKSLLVAVLRSDHLLRHLSAGAVGNRAGAVFPFQANGSIAEGPRRHAGGIAADRAAVHEG